MPSRRRIVRPLRRSDVDLHTHTTASDGLLSPTALVELARARGLRTIALTDHDSTGGVDEAQRAGVSLGVDVIAGVELSARHGDQEVHILAYYVDASSANWQQALVEQRKRREGRAHKIVARLAELGAPVSMDCVRRQAGPGAIGRPHIARALVAEGHARSASEAFSRWLGRDRAAFVPVAAPSAEEMVELVGRLGAVAVIAHPAGLFDLDHLVERLASVGLAGIESYYSHYRAGVTAALAALAHRHRLIATGGSDFHGEAARGPGQLGGVYVPSGVPLALRARLGGGSPVAHQHGHPMLGRSEAQGHLVSAPS